MPTLGGSNIDPKNVNSIIDRREVFKDGGRKVANDIRESLAKWKSFEGTRTGQIVCNLAQPMIAHINGQIRESVLSLSKKLGTDSIEIIKEYRAECRGALKVWEDILYRSSMLETRLNELNKFEEGEEERVEKKARKEGDTPPEVEDYV